MLIGYARALAHGRTVLRTFAVAAMAATFLVLAACGGGGGGGGGTTAAPSTPAPAISRAEAFRFLNQATFGATEGEAQNVQRLGYDAWITQQLSQPASLQLPIVRAAYDAASAQAPVTNIGQFHADRVDAWFRNAVRGPDQLRQRVAFALSEIMVVSQVSLTNFPLAVADYYDLLARDAFGDFRKLMEDVTLHPAMGLYLNMLGNQKSDPARNIRADENYARELMQLFTVGLVQLNADGSAKTDAQGQPIPTYTQDVVEGFAATFTGWRWAGGTSFATAGRPTLANQSTPMQGYPDQHDVGAKKLLSYTGAALTSIPPRNPAQPAADLKDALDNIFNHPNVGPFISRQLIQKLVTSNPSPAYVARVTAKFNDDGTGRRGNLGAVVRATLLDDEARRTPSTASEGKLKEPLLRLTQLWRAYDAKTRTGEYRFLFPNPSATFGQGPLQAGSVFNFFSPFYAPAGEIANGNLVAPEAQIATEFLNTSIANYFYAQAAALNSSATNARDTAILIDIREEQGLAGTPDQLVDRVAAKLLGGQISATLRTEAIGMVGKIAATNTAQRTAEAIYLVAASPEFAMQR